MLSQKSTHANFSVDSIEDAKDFYVNQLGFTLAKESEGNIIIESASGTRANIYYKEDHTPWDSTVFGIEVDDVEAAIDELDSSGILVEKIPGSDERGIVSDPDMGDATWLKDPAGNWVCISTSLTL